MDTAMLGLRVALSLACVLGLIWFAGRRIQGSGMVRKQRTVPMSVLGRQSLGKGAGIALVEVAGRVLLLGVGEQGVRVLTEVDVPEAPAAPERVGEVREEIDLSVVAATDRDVLVAVPDDGIDLGALEALGAGVLGVGAAGLGAPNSDGSDRRVDPTDADGADVPGVPDADDDTDTAPASPRVEGGVLPQAHADGAARMAALAGLAAGKSASEAGALHGSVLSPDTWRRAVDVVQRRTARR